MKQRLKTYCWQRLTMLLLCLGFTIGVKADYDKKVDGINYRIYDAGYATVQRCEDTTSGSVHILSIIDNNPVNTIEEYAFSRCSHLTDVSIPSSIKTIGHGAFNSCSSLTSINIPSSVNIIESYTFSGCSSLASISIPSSVNEIKDGAFNGSSSLKIIRFEDGESPIKLGVQEYNYNYKYVGLFADCPLEEVYIGRNIDYSETIDNKSKNATPFANQRNLAKVTISPFVTRIPDYLFNANKELTVLSLPNTLKTIGAYAFENCSKIAALNLGNQLESIGDGAFLECHAFTKIVLPETTKAVGAKAFKGCSSITEVTIGTQLKSIGEYAFDQCRSFTALVLPKGFKDLGKGAFRNCIKLTVAQLGDSLTSVPEEAFRDCIALTEINLPATVKMIGDKAFYNDSSLAVVTMREGLERIGNQAFYNNAGVIHFSIPGTVESIGENCFMGCHSMIRLTFRKGEGVLTLSNKSCTNSAGDRVVYDYFYDSPIRTLYVGRNLEYRASCSRDNSNQTAPFHNKKTLRKITFDPCVTYVPYFMATECSNLTEVIWGQNITDIGEYAFYNCKSLTKVEFPHRVATIGNYAYAGCTQMKDVTFQKNETGEPTLSIGTGVFMSCIPLNRIDFPGRLINIGSLAFDKCINLQEVIFEDDKSELSVGGTSSSSLFKDSPLRKLYIGRNINYKTSPFLDQDSLIDVQFSHAGTVTVCNDYLLAGAKVCKNLILPESLVQIGTGTFSRMETLCRITIPHAVKEMGAAVFEGNKAMKSVRLSDNCAHLKERLFADCDSLLSISIPPVVIKMEREMFRNCKALTQVEFRGGSELLAVADYLFKDSPIVKLNLDRWITYTTSSEGCSPFYKKPTLNDLTIGFNVKLIDQYMFTHCTGLEKVHLSDSIKSVGRAGFKGCTSLKQLRLSKTLEQIGDYGFADCTFLDSVYLPASMTSVASYAFSKCTSLKLLDLGKSLKLIGPAAFKDCSALEGIEIPETLYGLGVEAFANCISLPYVAIKGVSSVGKLAFSGCTGLKGVSLSSKTTSLGENSFAGCTNIGYVKSYADMPPEGLVIFANSVVANGTLFVPQEAIEDYKYSPTWEQWLDIRPITEDVLVTSITLNQTEVSLKATETVALTATVGAANAVNKEVIWRTSNAKVAKVNTNGLVEAVSVGMADVIALAADGSGVKAVCQVKVLPTLVESVTIESSVNVLKKGRSMTLKAMVLPLLATDTTVVWTSSDNQKVTVEKNGLIKAIGVGTAQITATASDGSGKSATISIEVIPPTKGDANDDDHVTVTDAVNIANYAVGKEVARFCVEAADVNGDNMISLADATGAIDEVLKQPVPMVMTPVRTLSVADDFSDRLVVDNFTSETSIVDIKLENMHEYVALQADVLLPEGMLLEDVAIGEGVAHTHQMVSHQIDDHTVRLVWFNASNVQIAAGDDAIVRLTVRTNEQVTDNIQVMNIVAADANANEYHLSAIGGLNGCVSGLEETTMIEGVSIQVTKHNLVISNAQEQPITIYRVDGSMVASWTGRSTLEKRVLNPGVYVVKVGNTTKKVVIK